MNGYVHFPSQFQMWSVFNSNFSNHANPAVFNHNLMVTIAAVATRRLANKTLDFDSVRKEVVNTISDIQIGFDRVAGVRLYYDDPQRVRSNFDHIVKFTTSVLIDSFTLSQHC